MDLRLEKTNKNITEAFLTLRATKPIEKITIKELSELAYINKTTFYRHYEDIYALSDTIENDLIKKCVDSINDTNTLLCKEGLNALFNTFISHKELFKVIFSGSRKDIAIHKFHDALMDKIFKQHPDFRNDNEKKIMLSTMIYGTFHAYQVHNDIDLDTISNCILKSFNTLYNI